MQTTPSLPSDTPSADLGWLWTRAAALMAALLVFIGSPARLIRSPNTTRRKRRALNFLIAPIEALVRSLLMSEAIALLTGTEEGAEILRNARSEAAGDTQPAAPARTAPVVREVLQKTPSTDETTTPAADRTSGEISDADIAKILAPNRLYFQPYEIVRHGYVVSGVPRKPADPSNPPRRRASPNTRLARRIEVLRLIIANPRPAILALARDLATRQLHELYVPGPRIWIDERWAHGHGEIREARRISSTRFRDFEKTRNALHALPQPEPG